MSAPELAIIIPIYNGQASVRKVFTDWFCEIENYSRFLAAIDKCNLHKIKYL
jgi:hypothetical protein